MKIKSNNKPAICLASVAVLGMLSTRPPQHTSGQGQGLLYPRGGTLRVCPHQSRAHLSRHLCRGLSCRSFRDSVWWSQSDSRNWFPFSIRAFVKLIAFRPPPAWLQKRFISCLVMKYAVLQIKKCLLLVHVSLSWKKAQTYHTSIYSSEVFNFEICNCFRLYLLHTCWPARLRSRS